MYPSLAPAYPGFEVEVEAHPEDVLDPVPGVVVEHLGQVPAQDLDLLLSV